MFDFAFIFFIECQKDFIEAFIFGVVRGDRRMKMRMWNIIVLCSIILLTSVSFVAADRILIYMDLPQTDHLKAYGVAYWTLEHGINVEWLLNYRGGSFMMDYDDAVAREARIRGVAFSMIGGADIARIYHEIEENNMEVVLLEKAPAIAIYAPSFRNAEAWDDAVSLALDYAEIPYTVLWDEEVLRGELEDYDWLHLHHEDFTGQYGKFYGSYRNAAWYQRQVLENEAMARKLGFEKVSKLKLAVAKTIKEYVLRGGFVFAMCSATDSYDIALAAENTDIAESVFDGDPSEPGCQSKLDFTKTFAFEDFRLIMNPLVYEFSNIDTTPQRPALGAEADYFTLFEFSAKYDPVPTMLTQCHVPVINGFMGQTTGFNRETIKKSVVILGEMEGTNEVKYLHGNEGRGTFTFYGGHDPEDYTHHVGDPPTNLAVHKNSPGYRLILNNILFPAARKKERKT